MNTDVLPSTSQMSLIGCIHRASISCTAGLADLIIPPTCLACQEPLAQHDTVCASCWTDISFIRAPLCDRLELWMQFDACSTIVSTVEAAHPPDFARAVAHFDGVMREMILQFKYGDTLNARKLFGRWLTSMGAELITGCDIIAPVPMQPRRLLARRFNQSAILGQELARTNKRPYAPRLVNRVRNTQNQVGLTSDQRRRNLAGAFTVSQHQKTRIEGRRILLVDDVITTGTTP
jgi:ComF family protein